MTLFDYFSNLKFLYQTKQVTCENLRKGHEQNGFACDGPWVAAH